MSDIRLDDSSIDRSLQSVDLTELAKQGKLDPTIGRDEGALPHIVKGLPTKLTTMS